MLRVKSPRDLGAAAMFILIGIAGLWFGRDYTVGTAARMGAGYMPTMLSWLLIGFGFFVGLRALRMRGPKIESVNWRSAPVPAPETTDLKISSATICLSQMSNSSRRVSIRAWPIRSS